MRASSIDQIEDGASKKEAESEEFAPTAHVQQTTGGIGQTHRVLKSRHSTPTVPSASEADGVALWAWIASGWTDTRLTPLRFSQLSSSELGLESEQDCSLVPERHLRMLVSTIRLFPVALARLTPAATPRTPRTFARLLGDGSYSILSNAGYWRASHSCEQ